MLRCFFLLAILLNLAWTPGVHAARKHVQTHGKVIETEQHKRASALCGATVVAEACAVIAGADATTVTPALLAEITWASDRSVGAFLEVVGLKDSGDDLSCLDLCEQTVNSLPQDRVPPANDVGCRRGIEEGLEESPIVCDVDLGEDALKSVTLKDNQDIPDMPDRITEKSEKEREKREKTTGLTLEESAKLDFSTVEMVRKVANLYQIYPLLSKNSFEDIYTGQVEADIPADLEESGPAGKKEEKEVSNLELSESAFPMGFPMGFPMHQPFQAQLPEVALIVGDEVMAHYSVSGGKKSSRAESATVDKVNGGDASVALTFHDGVEQNVPAEFIKEVHRDGSIFRPEPVIRTPVDPKILQQIEKIAVLAQGYVSNTLIQIKKRATKQHMQKWYGRRAYTNTKTRAEIVRLINSIDHMLNNVDYVYPGPGCDANTYAYVYPDGAFTKNDRGQFIYYLCPLYMNSWRSEQIQTLVHEGSHHATSFTNDVCTDGSETEGCDKAYGREVCEQLAKEHPAAALRNADSLGYYISNVNGDYGNEGNLGNVGGFVKSLFH